jgi:hypothetical protein
MEIDVNLTVDPYRAVTVPPAGTPGSDAWLAAAIAWGVLSPSPHNAQPWRWSVNRGVVTLREDRSRLLTVSDPDGREMAIGCGCALEHYLLRIGLDLDAAEIAIAPDGDAGETVAHIRPGTGAPLPRRPDLVAVAPSRRTDRTAYAAEPLPEGAVRAILAAPETFGAHVRVARTAAERDEVCGLVMEGDRQQMGNPAFRRELSDWMRPAHNHAGDGMPADLLGQHGILAEIAPLVVRTFDVGKKQAARDHQLLDGSPLIAVLWTDGDTRADRIAAGRGLARLLLEAAAAGVAVAYMNQPCELPELRVRLAGALGLAGHPQLVIRLGISTAAPHASPRRPVAEVLDPA